MTDIDRKKLAKDVAKQLDRRRMRRRVLVLAALLAAAIAALLYLRCGKGWGTGKQGDGGKGVARLPAPDAGPVRCALRLGQSGITLDGKPATRDEAVARCKQTTGADVLVTGDARQGDWDELRAALEAAGIPVFTREPRGVTPERPN